MKVQVWRRRLGEVKETDRRWRENPKRREKRVPVRRGSKRRVRLTHWHRKSPLLTSRGGTCECVLWSWTATASVRSVQVAAAVPAAASAALQVAPARARFISEKELNQNQENLFALPLQPHSTFVFPLFSSKWTGFLGGGGRCGWQRS